MSHGETTRSFGDHRAWHTLFGVSLPTFGPELVLGLVLNLQMFLFGPRWIREDGELTCYSPALPESRWPQALGLDGPGMSPKWAAVL